MARGGPRLGGRTAVASATALAVGSLVAGTLYVSSVGSEALQRQLASTCLTDAGAVVVFDTDDQAVALDAAASALADVADPIITRSTPPLTHRAAGSEPIPVGVQPRLRLLARDGQTDALGLPPLAPGQVLLPDWVAADVATDAAGRIDVLPPDGLYERVGDGQFVPITFPDGPLLTLQVVGTYPDIPVRPEPSFWCGLRDLFRPSAGGDRPLPVVLVAPATLDALPAGVVRAWELRPDPAGLRRDQARALAAGLTALPGVLATDEAPAATSPVPGLATLVDRADRIAEFVARTIAPVRVAAALAALVLLVGAGVLVVREQRRELRLRVVRGVGPVRLAVGQLRWMLPATLVGALVGAAGAVFGVRIVGPTPELEPQALLRSAALGAVGWSACLGVLGVVVGAVGSATVDRPVARRRARTWLLPELALVILAAWSFSRLDRIGGVRQSGTELRGGDLVAQAFPLLAAVALAALVVRPLRWLLRRLRGSGDRLPTPVLIGWRRVLAEPSVAVTIAAATALATSFAVQATSLTDSVERLLTDKAAVFVGTDLAIDTVDPPGDVGSLGAAATVVNRVDARAPATVEVLGVDPATFEAAAFWRDDADPRPLGELLDAIRQHGGDGDVVPALVVGDAIADDTQLRLRGRYPDLTVDVVATPSFFPGFRNGTTLVVVDRATLGPAATTSGAEVWVRAPRPDAVEALRAEGVRVRGVRDAADVFGVTDFLSTRWGYAAFTALGIVIAVVTLLGQLLVLDARRSSRRVAHVLVRRMGLGRGGETIAIGVEVGVPLVGGALIGTAIGWAAAGLATSRLDALRNLEPKAVLVVDTAALGAAGIAVVAVVGVLALVGMVGLVRTRAMEVMRAVS